jgi:hypothetical protein
MAATCFALQAGPRCLPTYTPPMEEQKEAIQCALEVYPHQHPDEDSQKTYLSQLTDWAVKYGSVTRISEQTPYPLKLGTVTICSGECFWCTTHSHDSRNCPAMEGDAA